MNPTVIRQLIAADILKLRRHRPTMIAATILSVGITVLYLTFILARHNWQFPAAQILNDGTSLIGLYFGSIAAILIGTEAGVVDLSNRVFRDLAATGRSRTLLFATRIPAAVLVSLVFTLASYLITAAAAYAFHGTDPGPDLDLVFRSGGWVVLATAVVATLAVSIGSITGSSSITLITIIGWQTLATGILYLASFLGSIRWAVLSIALSRFLPAAAIGSRDHPGSSNVLTNYKLTMPAAAAAFVILGWVIIPALLGAWRTARRDA
jgi:hypothetical protein